MKKRKKNTNTFAFSFDCCRFLSVPSRRLYMPEKFPRLREIYLGSVQVKVFWAWYLILGIYISVECSFFFVFAYIVFFLLIYLYLGDSIKKRACSSTHSEISKFNEKTEPSIKQCPKVNIKLSKTIANK